MSSSLTIRSQSLDVPFPSYKFGNIELIMVDKLNSSKSVIDGKTPFVPKVILEKIKECLDYSTLPLEKFQASLHGLDQRFFQMHSYHEDSSGCIEQGILLDELHSSSKKLETLIKNSAIDPSRFKIGWKTNHRIENVQDLGEEIYDLKNQKDTVTRPLYNLLQFHLVRLKTIAPNFSREISRLGTEFMRRSLLEDQAVHPEKSQLIDLSPNMSWIKTTIRDIDISAKFSSDLAESENLRRRTEETQIKSAQFERTVTAVNQFHHLVNVLTEQQPYSITDKMIYGPIRKVKKALGFKPY